MNKETPLFCSNALRYINYIYAINPASSSPLTGTHKQALLDCIINGKTQFSQSSPTDLFTN